MPLRLRLALWYGGLAGLIIVLVCTLIYALHSRAHYDEVDRALAAAAEHVAGRYAAGDLAQVGEMLAVPIAPNAALRVYGPGGEEQASGPNAGLVPAVDPRALLAGRDRPAYDPIAGLAPRAAPVVGDGRFGLADGEEGRWRLYVTPAGPGGYVLAAAPLGWLDASIAGLRRLLVLLALGGAGLTFASGWLLAGSALRPIATLTRTAGLIARSRQFDRRVAVGVRPDELGRLATTFNEMLASLEGAYRAQQRFVGDASHELRAPLTAIQANLELLERRPDLAPGERREAVAEAGQEVRRLAQLVADLLALARADAGVALNRRMVELDRVLLDTLAEARHLANGQRLEIGALEPVRVEGDPDRLKQLLLILLDNAIKYTPPEGRVALALRRNATSAEVTVRDTGVGIAPQDLAHVFDRFYRADPARARDPGGTGLGLPIARWIAEEHGGRIELSSTPGEGTVVCLRLPIAADG